MLHYYYFGDLHSGSVFGVGIRRRTGRPRYLSSIPGRGNRFVFSSKLPSGSGPTNYRIRLVQYERASSFNNAVTYPPISHAVHIKSSTTGMRTV
jgi:hypothetical protein